MLAQIKDKQEIAKGALWIEFDLLGQEIKFKPGQYFFITIPKLSYPDERGNRRHFSIVNSPQEKGILSFATRITGSGFKKTLLELPLGSKIEVGPIQGGFILPEDSSRHLVFIAGGIGITPFMSMLKTIKLQKLPHQITLLYFNKERASTAFFQELEKLSTSTPEVKIIFVMTDDDDWEGEKGRINSQLIKRYVSDYFHAFFMVAGPPGMNEGTVSVLKELAIENMNIKQENFSGY